MVKEVTKRTYRKNVIIRVGWIVPLACFWLVVFANSFRFWAGLLVITGGLYFAYLDKVMKDEVKKDD